MTDVYVFVSTQATPDIELPIATGDQNDFNRRIVDAFEMLRGGHRRAGDLKMRPTSDPLRHHLLCDGSAISRTQFPRLFEYLGTTYGVGDGTTTFNLPNYLNGALTVPATALAQTIDAAGVVTTPATTITAPVNSRQTHGGNVVAGGRRPKVATR